MLGQPVVDAMRQNMLKDGIEAQLGIIQVGNLPESTSYVQQVRRTIETVPGLSLEHVSLEEDCSPETLLKAMVRQNNAPATSGYMLQLPLPKNLKEKMDEIRSWIAPGKDVDHLGYEHGGALFHERQEDQIVPPTPYAVMKLLQFYGVQTHGSMMAIVGDGEVGRRLKVMAGNDLANQIVLNETANHLAHWTRQADIVVSAVGVPGLITAEHVREGSTVVGVGVKFVDGKLQSDIDVDGVSGKVANVTPRIGGLGPVTVMSLLQNVIRLARRKKKATYAPLSVTVRKS